MSRGERERKRQKRKKRQTVKATGNNAMLT